MAYCFIAEGSRAPALSALYVSISFESACLLFYQILHLHQIYKRKEKGILIKTIVAMRVIKTISNEENILYRSFSLYFLQFSSTAATEPAAQFRGKTDWNVPKGPRAADGSMSGTSRPFILNFCYLYYRR